MIEVTLDGLPPPSGVTKWWDGAVSAGESVMPSGRKCNSGGRAGEHGEPCGRMAG